MRKIKYLVAALLIGFGTINANPVLLSTAQKVAGNYYSQTYNSSAANLTLAHTEFSTDGQAVYYVFNITNEGGFVIVSAEDAGYPIIGSSNTGHYVIPIAGNNVDFWMTKRKNEVIAMRTNSVKATPEVTNEWNGYINNIVKSTHNVTSNVNPLCATMWDQSPYYNAMCPGGSVTGCVATAMAQIMKYWKYPSIGKSSWCYYDNTPLYTENYGQLCAYFDTSNYVWSAMPDQLFSGNKEIAKLMYDCGVSVDMDYSPSGSGALVIGGNPSAEYSYTTYFEYNPYTIKGILMANWTNAQWINLLQTELNNGRPVQYEGTDGTTNEGHSWVCDGYNSTNQLHMNWGWSGNDDAYYSATSLAPAGSGYDFNKDIGALIGIEPFPASIATVNDKVSISVYPNPSHGEFTFEIPTDLKNSQITIYNMLGQEVTGIKVSDGNNNINIGNQPKGVYLYRLLNENGASVSTGRLVVE